MTNLHKLPEVTFKTRVRDESVGGPNPFRWQDRTSSELFANKRIVLFALPGAFTPTCSSTHLPRYDELYAEFKANGVDEVYCLSVNDAFVMFQWGKHLGNKNIKLIPDGNGDFTRQMGMLVRKDNIGFGMRTWRYALVANNMEIEKMFVEPGYEDNHGADPFEVSDADTVLAFLKGNEAPGKKPPRNAFEG
ncbi:MAG: peroxiredoxin [Deltaproteobacteria bacterium]|nr:peroxiredoxin [Deltaproteobacteria bacterium]